MVNQGPSTPLIVLTGLLTPSELDRLPADDQQRVEQSAQELAQRYGEDWLRRHRERLRGELSFAYGVP